MLGKVVLEQLAHERERTRSAEVALDNEDIVVASHELDVERTVDV